MALTMNRLYTRSNGGIVIPVGPVTVDLRSDGDRICGHIKDGDIFEPESLEAWARMVVPGTAAIDVGAYSGLYAIAAAKLGAESVAFEPMAEMQQRARVNFDRNGVTVDLHDAAVSDEDGEGAIGYSPTVKLTSGASLEKRAGGRRRVRMVRLDSMMPFLPKVSAIKIDVERHEPAVIRGAAALIEQDRPALLIECLEPALRKQSERLIPAYAVAGVLDKRNILFMPR